jgi:hypothetical protein
MFLGRPVKAPLIRRVDQTSKTKFAHVVHVTHRDQVEAPITTWLKEAYELSDVLAARAASNPKAKPAKKSTSTSKKPKSKFKSRLKLKKPTRQKTKKSS